ncbi:lycopene cyclase [Cellulophaga baltica]|uniref:lycopene cyclase family protein n=1 Tax=Cellulophaga TaxID=104264 RepID=UPI001C06834B|nr:MULTISPECIES: lycopene cyclase family protein [Cellulophaga]MBU2997687.1 lycopene cyclase [Cellulophaga baltica]MDO6769082.1 lycopene cyclase family protein [Cellulophaga sp. 1_MG-2023]
MPNYDYIIIGAGLAGLLLADTLGKDPYFKDKSILLLDKDAKQTNNRTWCFWEQNNDDFNTIISKKWDSIRFTGKRINQTYPIAPYSYKMVRGIDFYNSYFERISNYKNICFLQEEVLNIEDNTSEVSVKTAKNTFTACKIFNSFYDISQVKKQKQHPVLQQHFIGWVIKTEQNIFDDNTATFMDFSIPQKGNTRFMYLLPLSKHEALIEYTLFSENLLKKEEYEIAIKSYLKENLNIDNYTIVEKERGSIPMTCYDFSKNNTENIMHIGTAGGFTKASTGYTFKNTTKKINLLIQNLKEEKSFRKFYKKDKFWFYDLLLLDILESNNELGQSIFEALFKNRSPKLIFKFLDEETNLWEDVKFISALSPLPFLKALFKRVF